VLKNTFALIVVIVAITIIYQNWSKINTTEDYDLVSFGKIPQASLKPFGERDISMEITHPAPKTNEQTTFGYFVSTYENGDANLEFFMSIFDNLNQIKLASASIDPEKYLLKLKFDRKVERPGQSVKEGLKSIGDVSYLYKSVGQVLVMPEGGGHGKSCTAFVVGDKKVLTNNHCIKSREVCDKAIFKIWDSKGQEYQYGSFANKYRCTGIEMTDKIYDYTLFDTHRDPSIDYGYFKIVDRSYKYDYGTPIAVLTNNKSNEKIVKKCEIGEALNSTYCSFKDSACQLAPNFYIANGCKIIQGDSGSPVVNAAGELIGVLFASAEGKGGVFSAISHKVIESVDPGY
jgi:hypothetical protein